MIQFETPANELTFVFTNRVSVGRYLRTSEAFVSCVIEKLMLPLNWGSIITAAGDRLQVSGLAEQECLSLIRLLLTIRTIGGYDAAMEALKSASIQGRLSHYLSIFSNSLDAKGLIVAAIMLTNPDFIRNTQIEQSPNGDSIYNQTTDTISYDVGLMQSVAKFVESTRSAKWLFEVSAKNKKIQRMAATIIGILVNNGCLFDVEPSAVLESNVFLESYDDRNPLTKFIACVTKKDALQQYLVSQQFQIDNCHLYSAALTLVENSGSEDYFQFLATAINQLPQKDWLETLNAMTGPHYGLLKLCSNMRSNRKSFYLSTEAGDALLDQLRKLSRDEIKLSQEIQDNVSLLYSLLSETSAATLINNALDDAFQGLSDFYVIRTIEILGEHLVKVASIYSDGDKIVRRIFAPLLSAPNEKTSLWIYNTIKANPKLTRKITSTQKDDFILRLSNAVKQDNVSVETKECLINIAEMLGVNLGSDEEAVADGNRESKDSA